MTYLASRDFLTEVRLGNITGAWAVNKFGRTPSAPNGSWGLVSELGGTGPVRLSAHSTVKIKSGGDAADTAAGTGARSVTVQGIDSTQAEVSETITTAGASESSATTASFWRVHRAWVETAGTGYTNAADIVIETSGSTDDLITVSAGEGQSQHACFTIPAGKQGLLTSLEVAVDGTKSADIRLMSQLEATTTAAPFKAKRLKHYLDGVSGTIQVENVDLLLPALADVWIEANGGGSGVEVSASFEILIFDA